MKLRLLVLAFILATSSTGRASFTTTFQPAALPHGAKIISSWTEQDLRFTTPNGLVSNDISDGSYPYNGTTYIDFFTTAQPLTIATVDSQTFSLFSVDLAEYSTVFATPKTITFIGTRLDGTAVNATFTTDGIIDGNGPLQDFQTFIFPASFNNLRQVTVNTDDFAMDNLQAAIVPEPVCLNFLLLALLLCILRARIKTPKIAVINEG